MPKEPLKHVKSGDPLDIPAESFNSFVDAARDYRSRQRSGGAVRPASGRDTTLIRNDSGSDVGRFEVLGIDGVIFDPTTDEAAFKNHPALVGDTPAVADHAGRFAVCLEPIAAGKIGRCRVDGVTPVQIDVASASHQWANVADATTANLASGDSGAARILYKPTGTGVVWAMVRIDEAGGGTATFPAKIVSHSSGAEYTVLEQEMTGAATFADKSGAANITACNLSELSAGTGGAVDDDTIVMVTPITDTGAAQRYIFEFQPYAKYLD